MPNFTKIHSVVAELFPADGQTDDYEVANRNFAKAS